MRGLALILLCAGLLQACSGAFFLPDRVMRLEPGRIGLAYQDIHFESGDGVRLHAWYLPAQGEAKGTVLFLHGNAQNISSHIASVYWLPAQGYNVLLPDYRGYGQSAGEVSLEGAMLDAAAALNWLAARPEVQAEGMMVFGQSLGGALAVYAVAHSVHRDLIKALVIDSAFSDFRGIVREKLADFWLTWPLQWPLSLTVSGEYSPLAAIPLLSPMPVLIIHGEKDRVVPLHHAEALYAAARQPKTMWRVAGADHIEALTRPEQRQRFLEHLNQVFAGGRGL